MDDLVVAGLARCVPGADSAARLAGLAGAVLSAAGRVDALVAVERHLRRLQALGLELLAGLDAQPLECIPGQPDALEAALLTPYCPADVMVEQLDRLNGLIGLDTVQLGVLPLRAPLKVSPKHGFWIFDERLVIAETVDAEMWLDEAADVSLYGRVWEEFHGAPSTSGRHGA